MILKVISAGLIAVGLLEIGGNLLLRWVFRRLRLKETRLDRYQFKVAKWIGAILLGAGLILIIWANRPYITPLIYDFCEGLRQGGDLIFHIDR